MEFKFKQENRDVESRRKNCEKIRTQFPDKIPIICEKDPADDVRAALEKFMEQFGLDTSKRDHRNWMEIINGGAV